MNNNVVIMRVKNRESPSKIGRIDKYGSEYFSLFTKSSEFISILRLILVTGKRYRPSVPLILFTRILTRKLITRVYLVRCMSPSWVILLYSVTQDGHAPIISNEVKWVNRLPFIYRQTTIINSSIDSRNKRRLITVTKHSL